MNAGSLRRRVRLLFGSLASLVALGTPLLFLGLQGLRHEVAAMETQSIQGLVLANRAQVERAHMESLLYQLILEQDVERREAIQTQRDQRGAALQGILAQYGQRIAAPRDRELFEAVEAATRSVGDIEAQVVAQAAYTTAGMEARRMLVEAISADEAFDQAMQALIGWNQQEAVQITDRVDGVLSRGSWGLVIVAIVQFAVYIALALGFGSVILQPLERMGAMVDRVRQGDFTRRLQMQRRDEIGVLADGFDRMSDELAELVSQVQSSGVQVDVSVKQIAATSKQQQATASEVAATTTEIGATSREISATSKELVRTMDEVSGVADRSAELAGGSQAGLGRMETTMRQVMEAAGGINAKLGVLSEKAGNISQVVTTITKVADQTNLLSLNAAIEAEKAGEYGRGFAVVATEIRRLADQTAVATYDIETMVKEIQSAVAAGVMGMDKFSEEVRRGVQEIQEAGSQLTQLIQQVQDLAPRVEAVTEGMQAQATGAEQISQALGQLSDASQQTVESLRQSSQAIHDLDKVATALRSGVSRFKVDARKDLGANAS